jgi:uncharacterized protein involved in type VI secretion and phage assembly
LSARPGVLNWRAITRFATSARSTANRICNSFNACAPSTGFTYHFEHQARGHCVVFADGQGHFRMGETAVDFRAEGSQSAVRRFEVQRCVDSTVQQSAQGHSDLATLRSGQLMPLSGHPVRRVESSVAADSY